MSALVTAIEYINRGWSPVPVPFKQKGCKLDGWQKLRIKRDTASKHFKDEPSNVGVLLGDASGGLTDVDIDCPEALALAASILPPTQAVFGRRSKPSSHFLYKTDMKKSVQLKDPNPNRPTDAAGKAVSAMLVEVRSAGAQTVFPGSVHESGEAIEWTEDGELPTVDGEQLLARAERLAAAALLIRYWPGNGTELRHEAALALGGFLARCGGGMAEQAPAIVEAVARAAGDEEVADRRRAAEDAIAAHEADVNVYGLPRMRELFGVEVANRVADWLGYTSNSLLAQMNEQYFVIELGGKVVVGTFKTDATGNRNLVHYSFAAFRDLHDNHRIGEGNGIGKGSWWLKHQKRRQYAGIAFNAGRNGAITDTSPYLNLWQGFAVQPAPGDWSLMQDHIHSVLACNNMIHSTYITKGLAWAVQNPSTRAEVMLILKSEEEGTGKGALANQMVHIFGIGVHGIRIDKPQQLTGKHNAHLQRAALLYVDEAYWPGGKADEGAYKGLITEPYFAIEPKGIDIYFVPNCTHIICTSNNDWVVPASATARRFAVFNVSDKRVGDRAYFKALFDQMNNGGREAMLHDLLAMELGDWHPRNDIPHTDELRNQKLQSLDSELKWMVDLLNKGRLPLSGSKMLLVNETPSDWLFDDYIRHAGQTGARYKSISTTLGMKLRKWFEGCQPHLRSRDGSYPAGDGGGKATKRGTVYEFPPLDECRKAMEKHLNTSLAWDGPDEWVPSIEFEDESDSRPSTLDEELPF